MEEAMLTLFKPSQRKAQDDQSWREPTVFIWKTPMI